MGRLLRTARSLRRAMVPIAPDFDGTTVHLADMSILRLLPRLSLGVLAVTFLQMVVLEIGLSPAHLGELFWNASEFREAALAAFPSGVTLRLSNGTLDWGDGDIKIAIPGAFRNALGMNLIYSVHGPNEFWRNETVEVQMSSSHSWRRGRITEAHTHRKNATHVFPERYTIKLQGTDQVIANVSASEIRRDPFVVLSRGVTTPKQIRAASDRKAVAVLSEAHIFPLEGYSYSCLLYTSPSPRDS
eukprot:TRINITY_DN6418_c0_g1_i17.p1 TRINITY_DN6418_c0_g1~~TRINITY_DN6418_c0_g1_i17.p1  ORF type:complete len:244 (+),score=44.13 TRINITY_DN6418_c0_g1_i17:234-965(+)